MPGADATAADAADLGVFRLAAGRQTVDTHANSAPGDREAVEPLLRQNATWFCQLRWIVIGALVLVGVVAWLPGIESVLPWRASTGPPFVAAGVLLALNLVFVRFARLALESGSKSQVRRLLWAQIVTDLLVLTGVIRWLGNGLPAAPFMYLFHVILVCIVFTPRASLGVAALAAALYLVSLLFGNPDALGAQAGTIGSSDGELARGVATGAELGRTVLPMLLIWAVIWYLVSRLATALKARDRALFVTNQRLQASIEERSKHMLQTTHQLKAPFAAIHAQAQLLLGGYCGELPPAAGEVLTRISERCRVLSRQIQEMLQLANLRSQGQNPPLRRELALDRLLEDVIGRVEPAAQQRDIGFERDLQPVRVTAVEDHLTMLADNLVVNAVTYSHPGGLVSVSCQPGTSGRAVLTVRDRGIGIPREKLPHIFEDYYRTEEAVQHNRGSTGLGLAIVRQVACEDAVDILVESSPGWGTRFTVTLPPDQASSGARGSWE